MTFQTPRTLLVLAIAASLAACGGGGSSAGPGQTQTANLTLKGTITSKAAGQLQVNGITISTAGATTRIERVERPESELKVGMVVTVRAHRGNAGSHEAEGVEIEFEDAVKGKVSEIGDDSSLRVGGQLVQVDDSTEFEDNAARLGSIGVDDRIRVSAVPDDRGGLRATRIDRLDGTSDDFEVKGVVSDLTAGGFTLRTSLDATAASTYTVNLAGGASLPAGLANGSFVEVRSLKPVQPGAVIEASSISLEDRLGAAQSEAEVEGIVTSGLPASFVAGGVTVTTTDATLWTGGVATDLVPGVKVEAEGVLQADGSLAARKVSFRYSAKLQGEVTDLAIVDDGSGVGFGTFKVNGITVRVDHVSAQRDPAKDLVAGVVVEVRGYPARDGAADGAALVVTRLELAGSGGGASRPFIQGVVTSASVATGLITILGKTIDANAVEAGGYHDFDPSSGVDGPSISKEAFFAAIVAGETVVKGRGRDAAAFVDPVMTAKEVELEGER